MKKHNIYKILEHFNIFSTTDIVAGSVYITFFNGGFFNIDIQNIIFNDIHNTYYRYSFYNNLISSTKIFPMIYKTYRIIASQ